MIGIDGQIYTSDQATIWRWRTRVTVTPRVAGTAHVILAVEDNGTPTLTSYRRVILTIGESDAVPADCACRDADGCYRLDPRQLPAGGATPRNHSDAVVPQRRTCLHRAVVLDGTSTPPGWRQAAEKESPQPDS